MYPTWVDWLMLMFCALLVLPWLIGGLLVLKDLKEKYDRRTDIDDRP